MVTINSYRVCEKNDSARRIKMIKVSVIIPVYNVEKYLRQCMDSVVTQTLEEIEIICVDDGSTDHSVEILQEYAALDSRVKILEQKNAGAGAARNNGMRHASGKYLSFLDADDFFDVQMLEKAYKKAEEDHADISVYKCDMYYTDRREYAPANWVLKEANLPDYQPFSFRQVSGNVFMTFMGWAWDKLFLREFVDKYQLEFQEQRTTNDLFFVYSAMVLAQRISIVPEVLVHQRRDAEESLSKTREKSWTCFYEGLKALKAELVKYDLYRELEKEYINYALHFTLWNYETLAEPTKSKLKEKLNAEWFEEMDIKGKREDYFELPKDYQKYLKIAGQTQEDKMSGILRKIKRFLRKIVPVGRVYIDNKMKDQQKNFDRQMKKEMKAQIDDLKAFIENELNRRDEWAKIPAELRRTANGRQVWVIKCPATEGKAKYHWGDYYYAIALQKYLERKNIYVVIDTRQDWGCDEEADVVLVLRGNHFYRPDRRNGKTIYIMWNISHPDMISKSEYELYDIVCVGSRYYANKLKEQISVPVEPLLQCTDTELFYPEERKTTNLKDDYIFIGSTRGVMRECVLWAAEDNLPLHVWGGGWKQMLPDHQDIIDGTFVRNEDLPALYRSAKATLNDHWKDMLDNQFINNRIFDALACGLPVISDGCDEMKEIFPEAVLYYCNKEEFQACIEKMEKDYDAVKTKALEQFDMIRKDYSFEKRAEELIEMVEKYKE